MSVPGKLLNRIGRVAAPEQTDFIEREIGEIKPDQAVIKVVCSAVCGSDVHIFHGKHPSVKLPVTIGHELSGTIERIGAGVKDLKIGDRVTLEPCIVCGECEACRSGNYNFCEHISFTYRNGDGAMANYVVAEASHIFKLPDDLTFEEGCLIEPLAVATHAFRRADVHLGDTALVIGEGAIGQFVTALLQAAGAEVTAADLSDQKLELAMASGASHKINSKTDDFDERVREITGGKGFDKTFECVGRESTFLQAMLSLKKNGLMTVVGIFENPDIKIPASRFVTHEIRIQGAQGYCNDFPLALRMAKDLGLRKYITHEFPLARLQEALATAADRDSGAIKVIVRP